MEGAEGLKSEPPVWKVRFCNDKRKCLFSWQKQYGARQKNVFNVQKVAFAIIKCRNGSRAVVHTKLPTGTTPRPQI